MRDRRISSHATASPQRPDHADKASEGGYDLGVCQGVGAWSDTTYNLSNPGRSPLSQVTVYEAKKRNPELTIFAHGSLKHVNASHFGYGTNHPRRCSPTVSAPAGSPTPPSSSCNSR